MKKVLMNISVEQYSKNLYDFIIKYKTIILITFFVGILVNAVDVFTIKFGIDSEAYAIENSPQIYYDTQRYGSWILYYLFPFARYHIISQLIGIFALTLASLLTVSRHNISNNAKLLFMLLFVTYPNFAFLQYYYFQSAYNFIGLLFTVIAYRLIEKNNISAYIVAGILLFIGISSYQTNAAIFLSVMMINVTLDYINTRNIKNSLVKILKPLLYLIFILLIYYLISKIFTNHLNAYHSSFLRYDNGYIDTIGSVITYIYRTLISYNPTAEHTANLLVSIVVLISFICLLIKHYKEKYYLFFILLITGCILSFFSLNIILGGRIGLRAEFTFAYYPAFILLLVYILNQNRIKQFVVVLAIVIISYHTTSIVKYQTGHYIFYKQEKVTTVDLMNKIYSKYPDIYNGKYKINFSGVLIRSQYHPLIKIKDTFGFSFFSLNYGNGGGMLPFMKLHGFPMDIQVGKITENMTKEIEKMPSYPNNDCIKLIGDTVIVKLSD